jgi:hypothetical protein
MMYIFLRNENGNQPRKKSDGPVSGVECMIMMLVNFETT